MPTLGICFTCGAELSIDAPEGLCSRCLLLAAISSEPPRSRHDSSEAGPVAVLKYFGEYELLEEIARGAMGVVFKARQTSLKRLVALKMILPSIITSDSIKERFRIEAESAAQLDHPNIVPIYEVGEHEGHHYFTMRLIAGDTLAARLLTGRFDPRTAAEIMLKIASAVHYAHERGILHRDLKPANILLDYPNEPHVADFSIAKLLCEQNQLTQTDAVMGTLSYMSPEQAQGKSRELTTASDTFSLGIILYEMLTGDLLFAGSGNIEILKKISEAEVPAGELQKYADRDLVTVCLKALAREPHHRYASAGQFAEDLGRWLRQEPVYARAIRWPEHLFLWCRRKPLIASLSFITSLLLLALFVTSLLAMEKISGARHQERIQRQRAEKHAMQEQQERSRAEHQRDLALYQAYVANIRLAPVYWEMENFADLERVLTETSGFQGKGIEWFFWKRQLHSELVSFPAAPTSSISRIIFSPDWNQIATIGLWGEFVLWDAQSKTQKYNDTNVTCIRFLPGGEDLLLVSADQLDGIKPEFEEQTRKQVSLSPEWLLETSYEVLQVRSSRDPRKSFTRGKMVGPLRTHAISADCKLVARVRIDKAEVWDVEKVERISVFDHEMLRSCLFTPDGTKLVTYELNGKVHVWDAHSGKKLLSLERDTTHSNAVAVSPDGTLLATGGSSWMQPRLWKADDGAEVGRLNYNPSLQRTITALGFSRDGSRIAIGDTQGICSIYEVTSSNELFRIKGHAQPISAIEFSPDGQRIATAGGDARIWKATGRPAKDLLTGDHIAAMVLSRNARRLAAGDIDGRLHVWDLQSKDVLLSLQAATDWLGVIAISDDGLQVAVATHAEDVIVWEIASQRVLLQIKLSARALTFSPDGRTLAVGVKPGVKLFELPSGREKLVLAFRDQFSNDKDDPYEPASSLAFSNDGNRLLAGVPTQEIRIWDTRSGSKLVSTDTPFALSVPFVNFSPDGKFMLALAGHKIVLTVFDSYSGAVISVLKGHTQYIEDAVFTPDGTRVITCSRDGTAKVWDWKTGIELLSLNERRTLYDVAVTDDGRQILVAGDDGIKIWEADPLLLHNESASSEPVASPAL